MIAGLKIKEMAKTIANMDGSELSMFVSMLVRENMEKADDLAVRLDFQLEDQMENF